MKLVDLLVERLEEWPESVTYFVQDVDGEVKAGSGSEPIEPVDSSTWIRHTPLDNYRFYSCLCTDWKTSIVTKDVYTKHQDKTQMKQDFRNTKIHIKSEEHSKAIQEAVFAAGGKWQGGGEFYREGINFIFLNDSLSMSYCDNAVYFEEHDYKEIQFPLPTKDVYTKKETQTKRKVRKDFDPTKDYSVNVEGCSEDEKKEVQQAFFDAGFPWESSGRVYRYLDAVKYTNTEDGGKITEYCMYHKSTVGCNMTAKEFLDLVYEPESKGHVHAELMQQYAEDAKTSKTPWRLWEFLDKEDGWTTFKGAPGWHETSVYRRKPKTHTVHGVEIPDLRVSLKSGDNFFLANPTSPELTTLYQFDGDIKDEIWVARGLAYQPTKEGEQAAILHSRVMLGIA